MFDWNKVKDPAILKRLKDEGRTFMGRCHFGTQGVAKTEQDVKDALQRLLDSGFMTIAFDIESNYARMVKELTEGRVPLHAAVSYPMGRMTLKQKLYGLQNMLDLGIEDTCVCIDWQAIFSGRYADVEREAAAINREFDGKFKKNAFVIPATLMGDIEIVEVCKALDRAGVYSIKVNPGAKLGVSYEEVALINRHFPKRFDIHPSGNIRTLKAVEKYLELGCTVIHTASSLDIVEDYLNRQFALYTGGVQ